MVLGLAGVVAGFAVFASIVLLAGSGGIDVRLGDDVFVAGQVERLAAAVEADGPIAIPDASPRRQRDLYLQHLGTTAGEGWLAFSAQAPGAERRCLLQWLPAEEEFVDPCSGRRYPADGEGLTQYATMVDDGILSVDLRQPPAPGQLPETPTSAPA